jgi:hypothetical protein
VRIPLTSCLPVEVILFVKTNATQFTPWRKTMLRKMFPLISFVVLTSLALAACQPQTQAAVTATACAPPIVDKVATATPAPPTVTPVPPTATPTPGAVDSAAVIVKELVAAKLEAMKAKDIKRYLALINETDKEYYTEQRNWFLIYQDAVTSDFTIEVVKATLSSSIRGKLRRTRLKCARRLKKHTRVW